MSEIYDYERLGGFCRLIAKPAGPSRLRQVLKAAVHLIRFRQRASTTSASLPAHPLPRPGTARLLTNPAFPESMTRRISHEGATSVISTAGTTVDGRPVRPCLMPPAATFHPTLPTRVSPSPTPRMPPSGVGSAYQQLQTASGGRAAEQSWGHYDHC